MMSRYFREEAVMDETRLEDKLTELLKEFGDATDLQASKLAKLAEQAKANRKQLENSINRLQELLDYLRVCIKYQAFDLEATRRENNYLRKLLEEENR
jgi:mevalonate kinase